MKIKNIRNAVLVLSGIAARKRERNRTPRVLFYHGVADTRDKFVESLHISPGSFRKQISYLQKHYEIISLDEFYERWESNSFKGKEITLTFDDGYKNNLTIVAPILKELHLPFTVFVTTRHIDSGKRFSTFTGRAVIRHSPHVSLPDLGLDTPLHSLAQRKKIFKKINRALKHSDISTVDRITEQLAGNLSAGEYQSLCDRYAADSLMSWEEVQKLHREYGCTIGSHCLDHFICGAFQEPEEIKRQITESKGIIEQMTGAPCHYLAYPNGDTSETALKATAEAGYRMAFTTAYKRLSPGTDPYALPRYGVNFNLFTFIADLAFKPR